MVHERDLGRAARRRTTNAQRSRGAAAVELALVLPLLCILLFGIISYGYMLSFRQAISQAAAEAARAAAVAPSSTTTAERTSRAQAAVTQGLGSYGVSCVSGVLKKNGTTVGTCTVSAPSTCTASVSSGSQCVKVSVDYLYKDNSLLPTFPGLGIVMPSNLTYNTEAEVTTS